MSLLRVCCEAGCGNVTRRYRCTSCEHEHADRTAADRARREPWRYLYGLTVWRNARDVARRDAGYRCVECGREESFRGRGLDVHHEPPLVELWTRAGGGTPYFDEHAFATAACDLANLYVLCDDCHASIDVGRMQALDRMEARRRQ